MLKNDSKFDFAEQDNAAWTSIERQVALDAAALSDVHDESYLWLDRLNSNDFKKVEPIKEGQEHLYEAAKAAFDRNESAIGNMKFSLEEGTLEQAKVRTTAQDALWQSLGMLIELKDKLIQFIQTQKKRLAAGDLSGGSQAKQLADGSISKAKTTLKSIDKLITGTHSAAYALSSPEQRDSVERGMQFYPQSLVVNTGLDVFKKYPVSGNDLHQLHKYAQTETVGVYQQNADKAYESNQGLARAYLTLLSKVQQTMDDLEKVQSEAHRETRLDKLENQLIPQLDEALKLNSSVMEMFSDEAFVKDAVEEQILPEERVDVIMDNLKQDRTNIENLRLNALVLLRGEALRQNAA